VIGGMNEGVGSIGMIDISVIYKFGLDLDLDLELDLGLAIGGR
jgi:hypothetical protein